MGHHDRRQTPLILTPPSARHRLYLFQPRFRVSTKKSTAAPTSRWVSGRRASAMCGFPRHRIGELARLGLVREIRLPGAHPKYSEADLARLVERSTSPPPEAQP
jgi:hypothetical protein